MIYDRRSDNMYNVHNQQIYISVKVIFYNTFTNIYCTCYPYVGEMRGATRNNYKIKTIQEFVSNILVFILRFLLLYKSIYIKY